jgi:3-keto-5-aminohexanoate cleavage enzyme
MGANERIEPLDAEPEMASLTLGTINFGYDIFTNPLGLIETFASAMRKKRIKPELEVFDTGMIQTGLMLIDQGLLDEPLHWSFITGVSGGVGGDLIDLVHMVNKLPSAHTWQVGGIGRYQLLLGNCAISMGGHVRVGAEDNIYYRKGQKIKSSAELVRRIAQLANVLDRPIASPHEARRILSLPFTKR